MKSISRAILLAVVLLIAACGGSDSSGHTADDVIAAFREAGLEAETARPMERDDYGAAPFLGQGTRFFIPSLGDESGGRIIVFENQSDLQQVADYYAGLGESNALFFSWVLTHQNILVQINGSLPEEEAMQYRAALESLP